MKNRFFHGAFIRWTRRGLAVTSGIFLSLGLIMLLTFLANYQTEPANNKPLLVVNLLSQEKSINHKKQVNKLPSEIKKNEIPAEKKSETQKKEITKTETPKLVEKKIKEKIKEIDSEPEKKLEKAISNAPEVKNEITKVIPDQTSPERNKDSNTDADTLPTPTPIFQLTKAPHFLHKASPVYPAEMLASGITGVVKLEVLIDKTGRVRKVSITKSAGELFDQSAKRAILASSFYPAKVGRKAVAVLLQLPVKYHLN